MGAGLCERAAGGRVRAAIGLLLGLMLIASGAITSGAAASAAEMPTTARDASPGLGFTLHTLYLSARQSFDLPTFEANVDDLAAQHMQWIRVDLWPDVIAPTGTAEVIYWNEAHLRAYDAALSYAKRKGLDVYLDTFVPSYAKDYTEADYLNVARLFYQAIAARYHANVEMWQIANEPNWTDFRHPSTVLKQPYSMRYVEAFNRLLSVARAQIKAVAPASAIVVNFALSNVVPMNLKPFLTVTAPNIDIIGIDNYPGTRLDLLDRAVTRIEALKATFHKPAMVVETGMCSNGDGSNSQSTYIPLYVAHFLAARPVAILIYVYQDSPKDSSVSACDKTYGVKDVAGNRKPSYTRIFARLQQVMRPTRPASAPAPLIPPGSLASTPTATIPAWLRG